MFNMSHGWDSRFYLQITEAFMALINCIVSTECKLLCTFTLILPGQANECTADMPILLKIIARVDIKLYRIKLPGK